MRSKKRLFAAVMVIVLAFIVSGCSDRARDAKPKKMRTIVASDTILSGMMISLLPVQSYSVTAILPPGQCPGHYDVKLSDIEKMKKADLIVSFKGMPFMDKAASDHGRHLLVDTEGHNWMAPDYYLHGLSLMADRLSEYFPEDRDAIMDRKKDALREVKTRANSLIQRINEAGLSRKPVIASSMQKEPLEWMGFRVVGDYGRPEAMSTKEIMRLLRTGKERHAVFVVDNLQSGPDTGKGIAESLGIPHVILTNFPSEEGYLETLGKNVDTIRAAAKMKSHDSASRAIP
jgi:zinc transport system substrate-binding protein